MKIGILGSGNVGQTLALGFKKHDYVVSITSRNLEKLHEWNKEHNHMKVVSLNEMAKNSDIIVLAVKGNNAIEALNLINKDLLRDKIIIDATNPISSESPTNGVLHFTTDLNKSLMEKLQEHFPNSHFVKAFNSIGSHLMVNPQFKEGKPTMFICGNNSDAKLVVGKILDTFGFEVEDMGLIEAARAIEPLCILWCIRGFNSNEWVHAFKLLKS